MSLLFLSPILTYPRNRRCLHPTQHRRCQQNNPRIFKMRLPISAIFRPAADMSTLINPAVLKTSLFAIVNLMTTLSLGVIASLTNLLPSSALSYLSTILFNIFIPGLLFTSIIRTLSTGSLLPLLPIPIASVLLILIGLSIGHIGSRILKLSDSERRLYTVCCGFGNSGALPLLFAAALFGNGVDPLALSTTISGISFYLLGWSPLFWLTGYQLLVHDPVDDDSQPLYNTEKQQRGSDYHWIKNLIRPFQSPPLVSCMLALIIGLIPPIRSILIKSPLFLALDTFGKGYTPVAALVLAGSLATSAQNVNSTQSLSEQTPLQIDQQTGPQEQEQPNLTKMVLGIAFTRFFILPLIGLASVRLFGGLMKNPFLCFAVLLESIMPPAQNTTLVLSMEKKMREAGIAAKLLLLVYILGVIPISVGVTLFLAMIQ